MNSEEGLFLFGRKNNFAFFPILMMGIKNSFSPELIVAVLFFVYYMSMFGRSKSIVAVALVSFLVSFSRVSVLVALGGLDFVFAVIPIEKIMLIIYSLISIVLIFFGFRLFLSWHDFRKKKRDILDSFVFPVYLSDSLKVKQSSNKFVRFVGFVFVSIIIPFLGGSFIGLFTNSSPSSHEVVLNFLTVLKEKGVYIAFLNLFVYYVFHMLPLILFGVFILLVLHYKKFAKKVRLFVPSAYLFYSAFLFSAGLSFIFMVFHNLI